MNDKKISPLLNVPKGLSHRAKISTSLVVDKRKFPDLWQELYNANLDRLRILEKINAQFAEEIRGS